MSGCIDFLERTEVRGCVANRYRGESGSRAAAGWGFDERMVA